MPSQRGNLNVSVVCLAILFATHTLASAPDTALAQNSESSSASPPVNSNPSVAAGGLAEIVVTAQKRGENLQDVPISVVAFSADALTTAGVRTTADLNIVTPGLVSFETANFGMEN